jgi:diguanylate cyclase (GGDEF)-like protein
VAEFSRTSLLPAAVTEALREAAHLSASLLSAHSPADVRRVAVSACGLLGGGPSAILAYDPLVPFLRVDESEGLSRPLALGFQFEVPEGFVLEVFDRAAAGENPPRLERALIHDLGFRRPVIYPLGAPARLRGLWVADARADEPIEPLLPHVLRQFAAVVSGALCAAETRGASERAGMLDALTGLHDRKSAETYLRRELARARRYREPLSLVSIDLDRFGELNEQWGYQNGDRVLKEVARLLIGFPSTAREMTGIAVCLRESDLAARFGPDAFLVLLPATAHEGARLAAERFLAGLRQHRVELDEQSVEITATGAVVTFPDDGDTAEELTVLASRLLEEAARAGGDRLVVAAPRPPADLPRERSARASPG